MRPRLKWNSCYVTTFCSFRSTAGHIYLKTSSTWKQKCLSVKGVPSALHIDHKSIHNWHKIYFSSFNLIIEWPWPSDNQKNVLVEYKYVQVKKRQIWYFFHLDLDQITLVLKLDLDMVKMYMHTQNKVPSCRGSKVIA